MGVHKLFPEHFVPLHGVIYVRMPVQRRTPELHFIRGARHSALSFETDERRKGVDGWGVGGGWGEGYCAERGY